MPALASPFSIDIAHAWKRSRDAMTGDMAQHLIDADAIGDRIAARECLLRRGYGRHAELLLDHAIEAAQIKAVAEAMREPDLKPGHETDGFTSAKIEIMAQDLMQSGAFSCEQQAILVLSKRGHGQRDIGRMVRRARARARELHAMMPKRISR